ncbi:hypothetical protein DFH11DRAFT_259577 [Phellopilus nigrolimitatus]|nr:hypothetical protein DFH11DRAFT_259577 [Phellopilus nigrolimitatus]
MCSAGTPSTSAMPVGARGNSNWRGDARARIGAAANAHSAATASADLKKEGDDITGGGSGVGQGQNAEGDDDIAEGAIASAGVGFGSGSRGHTASTVAHDRVERRLAWVTTAPATCICSCCRCCGHANCCTLLSCSEQWYADCFRICEAARSKRARSCSRCAFAQRQLKYERAGKSSNLVLWPEQHSRPSASDKHVDSY